VESCVGKPQKKGNSVNDNRPACPSRRGSLGKMVTVRGSSDAREWNARALLAGEETRVNREAQMVRLGIRAKTHCHEEIKVSRRGSLRRCYQCEGRIGAGLHSNANRLYRHCGGNNLMTGGVKTNDRFLKGVYPGGRRHLLLFCDTRKGRRMQKTEELGETERDVQRRKVTDS